MEVSKALKELSEPSGRGDPIKAAIGRAAKASGLSYWRTFDLWYEKARRIEQFELDAINDALKQKRERDAANELHELKLRLTRLEARLAAGDTDFHRPAIDALGMAMRGAR
jgi:ribosomal protein L29